MSNATFWRFNFKFNYDPISKSPCSSKLNNETTFNNYMSSFKISAILNSGNIKKAVHAMLTPPCKFTAGYQGSINHSGTKAYSG